jgi:undecaprenyl-diphosphatase
MHKDTVSGALAPAKDATGVVALLRRMVANLAGWIVVLVRAPRVAAPRWSVGALLLVALTVAVIVASMFFLDVAASTWARQLPQGLIDIAERVTNFGQSAWFLYPLGFVLLVLAAVTAAWLPPATQGVLGALAARAGFLFVAIGLPSLFDTTIKRMIGRARPYVGTHDDPFAYRPFIWRPEYASMPSGHATTACAAAIAIGAIWPRLRPVMWLYAVVILFSRVTINVHHPSDVIAGALVGVIGALLVQRWFAARGLVFSATDLKPYAGPSWRRLRIAVRQIIGAPPVN